MALLPPQEHNPCSLGHLSTASSQGPWMVDLADCNWWNMRGQITCKVRSRVRGGMTEAEVRQMQEKAANQWMREETLEEHLFSYMLRSTDLDEFIECYSDSVTVNFSVKDGSAEFTDENTIEMKFLQKSSGQFGFLRGLLPWIGEQTDSDGSVEWETWTTIRFHIDDDGLIDEFTIASPQFIREILGAIEGLYATTTIEPIGQDLGSTSE